jgi:hypothetical protein
MLTHINEYCKFANSLELGFWWQMLVRLGQSPIITNQQWRIGIWQWRNCMRQGFHNTYALSGLKLVFLPILAGIIIL